MVPSYTNSEYYRIHINGVNISDVKVYSKINIFNFFTVASSSNVITDTYCLQHQAVYRNFDR
jgi:hypothetical protein